ncbi:MAG: HAD family phosphatase [Candidatus Paceibacterota bacterium]|jgi:epoxide hydrolase-like predicted phosphatase
MILGNKIKAIGFDYSGVIAGWPSSLFDKKICEILNITIEKFHETYFKINYLINNKSLSKGDFFRELLDKLGKPEKYEDVMSFLKSIPEHQVNQEVLNLVDELKKSGYKIGLLSNNTIEAADQMRAYGLDKHFDAFVVSGEIGFMKPDPQAFRVFFEKLGFLPSESIFIDDTAKNLLRAKEIGFHPILFTDCKNLVEELNKLGVKLV